MPEWSADRELELACKVGSMPDFERALEEGADVNCDGGAPLFVSIMTGNRQFVETLVAREADVSMFLTKAKRKKLKTAEEIIAALMEGSPPPVDEAENPPNEVLQADDD